MELKIPKVLVIGTFHMFEQEGMDSKKRQSEIEEVVTKLANYKPTKIAVELVAEANEICNEKFKAYKMGTYDLEMNEIYQIGFRLGNNLGHNQIYPIDWMGEAEMDYGEIESWARKNQPDFLNEIYKGIVFPVLTENKTILDYYIELNNATLLNQLHKMYINTARIGEFDNYIGVNWLSWWYKRNLIMFSNLTRLIDTEEERILFIVGSSHSSIVTKFMEESEVCEVIEPLNFLA